ncbi:receptor-like protein 2 [Rosa rugosa]|uniref:receptor-like protein 2 n=1 Tax=Rosa rugosa TaxID=74645 RepID=UPI002B4167E8|nr:receptor-like protein 2 [Rosa rugosa]
MECGYFLADIQKDPRFANTTTVSDLCRRLVESRKSAFFPMIYRLICLVLTLPVSTATTERAFSSMTIIKNKLRNKMEDEFFDDLMVLYIEKEFADSIDNDSVIAEFELSGSRRLPSKGLKEDIFLSSSLGNLTHLTHLNLSHNSLSGSLDQSTRFFLSLNHLDVLDLSYNLLSGELPTSFFKHAWNMTSSNVSNNNFSGSIPSSICIHDYSPSFGLLDTSFNKFSGNISCGLAECSKLQVFHAGYNNLSGILPVEMYNATTLEEISLPANSLSGVLGDKMLQLANPTILDLSYNQLSGVLPHHFGKFSKLKLMVLDFNNLEGEFPEELCRLPALVYKQTPAQVDDIDLELAIYGYNGATLVQCKLSYFPPAIYVGNNTIKGNIPTETANCSFSMD